MTVCPTLYISYRGLVYFVTEVCTCSLPHLFLSSPLPYHICLFSEFITLLMFCCLFICFLDSTHKWNHTVFVFVWLISLSRMSCRSIRVMANGKISFFLWLIFLPVCVCVCVCVYTHVNKPCLLCSFICW